MVLRGDSVCCMGSVSAWVVDMRRFSKMDGMGSSSLDGEVLRGVIGSSTSVLDDVFWTWFWFWFWGLVFVWP